MPRIRLGELIVLLTLLFPFVSVHAQGVYLRDNSGAVVQPNLTPNTVALTFDDGPSRYTPQILQILKDKNVKATFFVIGNEAIQYKLLKEIYDQGNEIGNHTYSHPNLSKVSDLQLKLELNTTRLIISSQIGNSTRLFRAPYLGSDSLNPTVKPVIDKVTSLGYIAVGETIDSEDWRKPGIQTIVSNSVQDTGGIILLHDGGGNREQTVQALPQIIDYYKSKGFRFVTVSEALGLSKEAVMPPLKSNDKIFAFITDVAINTRHFLSVLLKWMVIILIIASVLRFLLVTIAAIVQSRRKFKYKDPILAPCSVIIPAYNEGAVIESCLKSILLSDYPYFEVIVIDDGSTDGTADIAKQIQNRRLHVLTKENGGKASALNYGITHSRAHFIIAIDADTIFQKDTIAKLMLHFNNPKVAAVSGNTKIVNRHKLITKLQSLEYIVGFNLDRRMGDLFDCITVVPGAIGAFRRKTLLKAGGFSFDTLAEDTDLTLSIKESHAKIVYDDEAIAYTEAPNTVKDLLKQRFRWTFGTMQSVWKHRRSFMNPKQGTLGLIGLPYLLFFQIIFPLFGPFFDLALLIGLLNHRYKLVLVSFIVYTLADTITSAIALKLDKEKLRNIWVIVPQRFLYRQLMYYVIARSFVNVLRGRVVQWGKLKREGTHLAKNA